MAGNVKFYGPQIQAAIEREMQRRIKTCCVLVMNHAKELLSVAGTGKTTAGRSSVYKGVTRKIRKGSTIYGANPSRPGEPPHKQLGTLRGSVAFEVAGLIGRVGSNLPYARFLELGTRHVAARPWLRRALAEKQAEIRAILSAPMKLGS